MIDGLYRAPEVIRAARCTYRQLDYWVRTGVIQAEVEASGSGSTRLFTASQLQDVKIITALRNAGISLDRIREMGPALTLEMLVEDLTRLSEEAAGALA